MDIAPFIDLAKDAATATEGASALVIATPWPEYHQVPADVVLSRMKRPLVFDASRFLGATLGKHPGVEYVSVGQGQA